MTIYRNFTQKIIEKPIELAKELSKKTNIEEKVWNYFIGGYQVLSKWLKCRKGRVLTDEEIKTYIKIIESLKQTIRLQEEIDKVYPEIEKDLISLTSFGQ